MFLLERFVTSSDLKQIEKYADRIFAKVGIDVEFTRHFIDRVNDERNKKQISPAELVRLFNKTYQKHGKTIARLGPDTQAVINDMQTDINMPFVLKLDRSGMLELIAKTIMRKKDFKTPNKKLTVEKYVPKKLYDRVTLPPPNADLTLELKKLKSIISRRTKEDELSVKNHDSDPGFAIKQYCRENDLIYPAEEVKQILKDIDETITYYKKHYNVSRPHEVDSSIIPLPSKTNKTRAYPSGHACQSRFIGKYVSEKYPQHREGIMKASDEGALGRVKAGFHYPMDYDAGNLLADKMYALLNRGLSEAARIPRKKGQPANSKKHSDLYTDENPKGTIHGLKFATVVDAKASVSKIQNSGKSHAHKIQAAIAMEQRARVMRKLGAAAVYRKYINKMKEVTKKKRLKEVIIHDKENVSLVQGQSDAKNFLGRINSHRSFTSSTASPISRYVRRSSRNTVGNIYNNQKSST